MRKLFYLLISAAAVFAITRFGYPYFIIQTFSLRGRVEITEPLIEAATRPNTMLFLVARNKAGVPVAVKKIINPIFPLEFRMVSENLIMPGLMTKSLFLEAFLNAHGELGVFKSGDLKGELKGPVLFRAKDLRLKLDTPAK